MGHGSSPSLSRDGAPTFLRFEATRSSGETSAWLSIPADAGALLVLGHGAGAGAEHPFMRGLAAALGRHGVATLRYNLPYIERRRRWPDPPAVCAKTVRSAVMAARSTASDLPLVAGGKSFGGRMTSCAQARDPLPGVRGLVFFGFPLHPAGKPSIARAEHLDEVAVPMLFLQGTRDRLAETSRITEVCGRLGDSATLQFIDDADHGFHVLKRSGRSDADALDEIASTAAAWIDGL